MRHRAGTAQWMALWCGVLAMGLVIPAPAMRLEPSKEVLAVEIVAHDLQGPSGMAQEPMSGHLYVAEKNANRISLIRDHRVMPVLDNQFAVNDVLPAWALIPDRSTAHWTESTFRRPADIAFDAAGRLYVAESGHGGRLLRFEPLYDGVALAQNIITPWIEPDFGFTSVQVDAHNRLYVTMQKSDSETILPFGSVMMRDPAGDWWLVDYGPFAEFSNVALDPSGGTLVFGEKRTADVCWYDTDRQMLFNLMERIPGIRHIVLLPDGTTLAAIVRQDETWSVVELDASYGRVTEWVGGLSEIGGLYVHNVSGELYISLVNEGRILRVRRLETLELAERTDRLAQLLRTFEYDHALPPKEWPAFFKDFIEQLDLITAIDHVVREARPTHRGFSRMPMSIDEFTSAIPVVAAKLRARLVDPDAQEKDPIEELSFLIFYPNRSMLTQDTIAPSISLLRAQHRSGRVTRTRFLPNKAGKPISENMSWEEMPEVLVSFPSGYYAQRTGLSEEGLLRVYFLGIGLGPDYWIDIHRGDPQRNIMVVEKTDGTKIEYMLEPFEEPLEAGGESVLVAGLKEVEKGWYKLGVTPVRWNLVIGEPPAINARHMLRIEELAGRTVVVAPSVADIYKPKLSKDELNFRRKVVLRAATRWGEVHF